MPKALLANNARSTLAAGISSSATTLTVASGGGAKFPVPSAGDYFYACLVDTANIPELVKVTARASDSMTIVRAQGGTAARAFSTGAELALTSPAEIFNEMEARIVALINVDGSVTLAKLADGVLTADAPGRLKMADGYVDASKIADGTITFAKIANLTTNTIVAVDATGRPITLTIGTGLAVAGGALVSTATGGGSSPLYDMTQFY